MRIGHSLDTSQPSEPVEPKRASRTTSIAAEQPPLLTAQQRGRVEACLTDLQRCPRWHGGAPVLLLERCWLNLSCVGIEALLFRLPPDRSLEAPELVRYRELARQGHPDWLAQQLCWEEFGATAFREALIRHWDAQNEGNRGWTIDRYLSLLSEYRLRFHSGRPRLLPMLVLARRGASPEQGRHQLIWLGPEAREWHQPMRHTCP